MLVLGDREVEASSASIRLRTGENLEPQPADAAVALIGDKIAAKSEILI